jgi:hypothetical protein
MEFLTVFLRGIALAPNIVQQIEAAHSGQTGDQKKQAALAIVSSSINLAEAVSGKHVVDATRFTQGLELIIDGVVACLNASLWAKP